MYNSVLDAHERSKDLEKTFKELTRELQVLNKEKEAVEKRRTEAMKKCTQLELDNKDLEERISLNKRAKVSYCFNNDSHLCLVVVHTTSCLSLYTLHILPLQEDARQQLEILQKEIQESNKDLAKITPLYDQKVKEEHDISRE